MRTELHRGWTVVAVDGPGALRLDGTPIAATVPGCVHLDLLASDLIPDPYVGENEAAVAWVGLTGWTYSTTFLRVAPAVERTDLVIDGLDTVAELRLNGVVVARTRNMHRSYRIDVTDTLREGVNTLDVAFSAPVTEAEVSSDRLGSRPHANRHPYNSLRKNASSFGWDWGPDLPSSGIWRPIGLESWATARIASSRPLVKVAQNGSGVLDVHVEVERASDDALGLRVFIGDLEGLARVEPGETTGQVTLVVPDVELWWPRGYGRQPLYDVRVELCRDDAVLDVRNHRVGFRSTGLTIDTDDAGSSFALVINGEKVLVRGLNWIPDDAFPSRVDRARVERSIRQAYDANANLLRVWGGGIYESEDFYNICDELGILVWQDFLFACAAYTEDPELWDEIEAEAREAVSRLSAHPSLTLWCGGNECLWGHEDWNWKDRLAGRTWGHGYYTELLQAIVTEHDPTRPYIPGSPYSPTAGVHPNDPSQGPVHIWDVWNERDYTAYLEYSPRFVSEFGFQGPPTWATLTRVLDPSSLATDSPGWLAHQKADDGQAKLERGMATHLPRQHDLENWHWAASLNQARAVATGIDHFRSLAPHCTGAVVWQLNDCWPVTSWAAVDGDGRRKPVWYAIRHSFTDRHLLLEESDGRVVLGVVNDSPNRWEVSVTVSRVKSDGRILATQTLTLDVGSRSAARVGIARDLATPGDATSELLLADADGHRAIRPFAEDIDSQLETPELKVECVKVPGGWDVTLTTDVFVRDLAVLADRLHPDAVVDDMLITLLPSESVTFHVSLPPEADLDPVSITRTGVIRSANDLLRKTSPNGHRATTTVVTGTAMELA